MNSEHTSQQGNKSDAIKEKIVIWRKNMIITYSHMDLPQQIFLYFAFFDKD